MAAVAALSACQPGGTGGKAGDATRGASFGESIQLIERDVEAPDVFQANDRALWDGRPSLGGVWVATPDVKDPERVIIRNETNGKFVIGALFKRERGNPGPAMQLSSDAAAALGILAGQPTVIDVVALRREEVPDPAAAPAASAPEAVADAAGEGIAEEQIIQAAPAEEAARPDAIAAAAAALDASEAPEAEIAALDGPPMTEAGREAAAAAATAEPAAPRRGNWFSRVFGRKQAATPEPLPAALSDTASLDTEVPTASGAAAPQVQATSLDAPVEAPAATQQVAAARPAAPVRAGTGLDRAYVQIGIFSVEENARNTATALSSAGVLPTVVEQESRGRKFWRVIVGPATTASDRAAVIRKAKDLGFTDAYAVSG